MNSWMIWQKTKIQLNFFPFRCGPCKQIAPFVDEMSLKYPNAHFLNVDVDECQETAASYGISAMPTFVFLRNKTRLALLRGADKAGLEEKIKQFYTDAGQDEDVGVKGMVITIVLYLQNRNTVWKSENHTFITKASLKIISWKQTYSRVV